MARIFKHALLVAAFLGAASCTPSNVPPLPEAERLLEKPTSNGAMPASSFVDAQLVTMPAVAASDSLRWQLQPVPGDARLLTHVAFEVEDSEQRSCEVEVRLKVEDGLEQTLAAASLTRIPETATAWLPLEADLARYAGKRAELSLVAVGTDAAFVRWGNPMLVPDTPQETGTPVFLISIDTLRADHVSSYGYARKTTPHLDAWAASEAATFLNCISPETWTLPAHMSMFTGVFPKTHGASPYQDLPPRFAILPELLEEAGYINAAFTGHGWWFQPQRGFGRGMHMFDLGEQMFRPIIKTRERLDAWLDVVTQRKQFVFFHNYDLHYKMPGSYRYPYEPGLAYYQYFSKPYLAKKPFSSPEKASLTASDLLVAREEGKLDFSQQEHETLTALYDDCIRMVDHKLQDFMESLKDRGLYEGALIIITSDHGEGLNDRGYYNHQDVWEEECRVPLFIKFPDNAFAGARFEGQVQLVDLMPTILAALTLKVPEGIEGLNLRAMLEQKIPPREQAPVQNGGQSVALRTNKWKVHWRAKPVGDVGPGHALFDLANDPREQDNLVEQQADAAAPLKSALLDFFDLDQFGWQFLIERPEKSSWRGTLRLRWNTGDDLTLLISDNTGQLRSEVMKGGEARLDIGATRTQVITIANRPENDELEVQVEGNEPVTLTSSTEGEETAEALTKTIRANEVPSAPDLRVVINKPRIRVSYRAPVEGTTSVEVTDELEEQLKSLGYLEAGPTPSE